MTGCHRAAIAAAGGEETWRGLASDRPEFWRDRLRLATDSVGVLARILAEPIGGDG